jgi:MoaA/NifB/PqqE/SkfB family radical SAM enzyme
MISLTKLLLDTEHFGDRLRYSGGGGNNAAGAAPGMGPVVVWNCTRACNLACRHCYASATPGPAARELTTQEGKAFLRSLVRLNVPAVLFSGGEPLMRHDIFELLEYSASLGLRTVLSTNGTLLDLPAAQKIRSLGVSYAGISLDGLQDVNDSFRGAAGAFERTLEGFRNCSAAGQKAGLRLSLTKSTFRELPAIFRLVEEEKISRVCVYHLVSSGRGTEIGDEDLSSGETREALDFLIEKTLDFGARGVGTEILTVDNHCDGIYLYLTMARRDEKLAERILRLAARSGGNRSGMAIGAVDWEDLEAVYPVFFRKAADEGENLFVGLSMDHGVEVIGPAFIPDPFVTVTYQGTLRKLSPQHVHGSLRHKEDSHGVGSVSGSLVTEDRGDPFQPA